MLPKNKRIGKVLFQEVLKTGRTISSPFFVFRYIPQKTPQYAFVVPKSVAKKAVDRNKLRRQGYNTLYSIILPLVVGIFFYKKTAKTAENVDIKGDILTILNKIRP